MTAEAGENCSALKSSVYFRLDVTDDHQAGFDQKVMDLLEQDYGLAPLDQALRAPLTGRVALATTVN